MKRVTDNSHRVLQYQSPLARSKDPPVSTTFLEDKKQFQGESWLINNDLLQSVQLPCLLAASGIASIPGSMGSCLQASGLSDESSPGRNKVLLVRR